MYCKYVDNFETTLAATLSPSGTTAVIQTAGATILQSEVFGVSGNFTYLTLYNGTDYEVVKVTSLDTGTDTITFSPAAAHTFASGAAVTSRVPQDALAHFRQDHTVALSGTSVALASNENASLTLSANTALAVGIDLGTSASIVVSDEAAGTYTLTITVDAGVLVWANDTAPSFGAGAEVLRIDFIRSGVKGLGAHWMDDVIFGTWSKATLPT